LANTTLSFQELNFLFLHKTPFPGLDFKLRESFEGSIMVGRFERENFLLPSKKAQEFFLSTAFRRPSGILSLISYPNAFGVRQLMYPAGVDPSLFTS